MTPPPATETTDASRARVLREFERCSAIPQVFSAARFEGLAVELDDLAAETTALAATYRARAEECRRHAASARARGMAIAQGSEGAPAWTPVILAGGAKPATPPPFTWWHIDIHDQGPAADVVMIEWAAPAALRRARILIAESGPVYLDGHRPDETTLRELAEDVERWAAQQEQNPAHHLESARWGARYHA